jgi:hypothetical protein
MSLVPLALRIITVRALRGQTYAEGRVSDSLLDPIDMTVSGEKSPVLVVSSDDDEIRHNGGKDILGADRRIDLVIEMAVASTVAAGDGSSQIVIPHTDAGMEAVLSIMARQVMRALMTDATPWANLWRRCVVSIGGAQSRRGGGSENGVRYAARQLLLSCHTLAEPYFGSTVEPGTFWADFLALAEAGTDLAPLANVIRNEIEVPATLTDWQEAAAALGISREATSIIKIAGLSPFGTDGAAPFRGATVNGAEYNEQAIEEATV